MQNNLLCKVCNNRSTVDRTFLHPRIILPGPGDDAYEFTCGSCGVCSLIHRPKTLLQLALTSLFNLQRTHRRKFFDKDEICEFVKKNWSDLSGSPNSSPTIHQSLEQELRSHPAFFESRPNFPSSWALVSTSPASLTTSQAKSLKKKPSCDWTTKTSQEEG